MADYEVNVLCKFPNNTDNIWSRKWKFPHNLILQKTVLMMHRHFSVPIEVYWVLIDRQALF